MSDKKNILKLGIPAGSLQEATGELFSPGRLQDFFSISKLCADDR